MEVLHPNLIWLVIACGLLMFVPRKELKAETNARQRMVNMWSIFAAMIGMSFFFGLARPQLVDISQYDAVRPATIIGMIDNSGSVLTRIATRPDVVRSNGYIVDRHDEVEIGKAFRESFANFAKKRNDDVVGLTMFGDQAYPIVAPALNNAAAIEDALKNYHEPNEGTDAPKSLNAVLDQFEKTPADHDRILLIATDGQFDIKPDEAAVLKQRIKDLNVTIYMVAANDWLDNVTVKAYMQDGLNLVQNVASEDNILLANDGAAVAKAFRTIDRFEPQNWEVRENRSTMDVTWMPLSVTGAMLLMLLVTFVFGNGKPKSDNDAEAKN